MALGRHEQPPQVLQVVRDDVVRIRPLGRQPELVAEAHRHLSEERHQRGAVRLLVLELAGLAAQRRERVLMLQANLVRELLLVLEQLLAELALRARRLVVHRGHLLSKILPASRSSVPRSLSPSTRSFCSDARQSPSAATRAGRTARAR